MGFGKYADLRLPEVVARFPSYFFWAVNNTSLGERSRARELENKARRIRVAPDPNGEAQVVVCSFGYSADQHLRRRLIEVRIVPEHIQPRPSRSVVIGEMLDLSVVRMAEGRVAAKKGDELLAGALRVVADRRRLTRRFLESFFDEDSNFDVPPRFKPGFLRVRC